MRNTPIVFIVFGAVGDLMVKKLAPSLFHLFSANQLPKNFKVVGFSKQDFSTDEFKNFVGDIIANHKNCGRCSKTAERFAQIFSYQQGLFESAEDYEKIAKKLMEIEKDFGQCSNRLFYLAVPPKFYETIFNNLADSGLSISCSQYAGWVRILIEKPFGQNLETAKKLDELLGLLFKEEQIFRLDHYLAKEMLQNILAFRFANNFLEANWNRQGIEKIEIKLLEKLGVEDRGSFYDGVGALRDVGQNHLLQMLALVGMDSPTEFNGRSIRKKREELLSDLIIPGEEEVKRSSFRAQYDGYRNIEGVNPNSQTETYFKIKAFLNSSRWRGVPIILESGKRMGEQKKEIIITFRHPSPCLCDSEEHYKNRIIFRLEPKEEIILQLWSKKPGLKMELEEKKFTLPFRSQKKRTQYAEEYEKLLLDCISGDQTLFVSTNEVKTMWRFIEGWKRNLTPLKIYKPNTDDILKESRFIEESRPISTGFKKEIGIIGLGKMGYNMAERLIEKGYKVIAFDKNKEVRHKAESVGVKTANSIQDLIDLLSKPRLIWLMVPYKAVDEALSEIASYIEEGDTIIDGGNSPYKESMRRAEELEEKGVNFLDVGISGGPSGAKNGASVMVGGRKELFDKYEALFRDIAAEGGYGYMGKSGAGHFVKMVHNGIEYGMMQALAEGFAIMRNSDFELDLKKVADIYNHQSVIESRLVGWLKDAFEEYGQDLEKISGSVAHTGEGLWTVETAEEMGVPAPIIKGALKFRIDSAKRPSYAGKILSALRSKFGGHKAE